MKTMSRNVSWTALAVLMIGAGASACPFCSVESQTLTEETQAADAVVLARLIKEAPADDVVGVGATDPDSGTATFEIVEVLRGEELVGSTKEIKAVYFGPADRERLFLIMGLGREKTDWTTPLPLSPAAADYVRKLPEVPPSGADRLEFFQEYLEHEDPLLAQDAYDEFARSPYADVRALGPRMHHDKLVTWINDREVSPSRRRLYFTMLGVCGTKDDLPLLEEMIVSDFDAVEPQLRQLVNIGLAIGGPLGLPVWIDLVEQDERRKKLGLDAMVACYLTLRGPEGLDVIDQRFLKNPKAEYTHVYSTIMALRFHGDEQTSLLPRERLLASMRLLLDNPDFADQVILDLSRWEDWSVLDRLVEMFKNAKETDYVKQPVVTYLTVASEQADEVGERAKAALAELERLDADTVRQARSLMAFGALGRARAAAPSTGASRDSAEPPAEPQDIAAVTANNETEGGDDIPDPSGYEKESSSPEQKLGAEEKANKSTTSTVASEEPSSSTEPLPLVVVGVPLLAAALLLGVYWFILRSGAV